MLECGNSSVPPVRASFVRRAELSLIRQQTGISLEEIEARTKISKRFLLAIEAEDYRQLPGGIYLVSYLRQYAEAVGMDPDQLVERYKEKMDPEPPETPDTKATSSGDVRSFLNRLFRVPLTGRRISLKM